MIINKILKIILIIFLMYQSMELWSILFLKIYKIIIPFLISFSIAYAVYPYVLKLKKLNIPKTISIIIVLLIVLFIISVIFIIMIPSFFYQLGSLFNSIIYLIKDIQMNYDIDFGIFTNVLQSKFKYILNYFEQSIYNNFIPFITTSINCISNIIIIFSASIYFLIDMDKIRNYIKEVSIKINKYNYIKLIDNSMMDYLDGFNKVIFITFFEYFIAFLLIQHPNALLLGFLASISNLIPYFGGLLTNMIALVTSLTISSRMFVKTLIMFLILSIIDTYIINPYIFSKTNKIHPIIVILAVFSGGILFGIRGIIISLPTTILIINTIKYYKKS